MGGRITSNLTAFVFASLSYSPTEHLFKSPPLYMISSFPRIQKINVVFCVFKLRLVLTALFLALPCCVEPLSPITLRAVDRSAADMS